MSVVAVVGAYGKMGRLICERLKEKGYEVREVDVLSKKFQKLGDLNEKVDLVVDFSNKNQSLDVLDYCVKSNTKLIMGTTGQGDFFASELKFAAAKIPIIKCDNFSENVIKFKNLAKTMSKKFDGEIAVVEAHHKHKTDFPSGTAKQIISAMLDEDNNKTSTSSCQNFEEDVINSYSIRGGTLFGRHEVHFLADDEEIVLTHSSYSRKPYINGLMRAVDYLIKENGAGLHSFEDIIFQ